MATLQAGPYVEHIFGAELDRLYRAHRGWLTAAVHTSIAWPKRDVMVRYDGEDYFLRGLRGHEDRLQQPCITVRTEGHQDVDAALRKIYRFSSTLGWYRRGYVDVVGHIRGSHPIRYGSGTQPFAPPMDGSKNGFDCNFMPVVRNEGTRKALAFWREGLRLEHVHDGYSFLSFYKVLESQFEYGKERGAWINSALGELTDRAAARIKEIEALEKNVGDHIFASCRCAVAHANIGREVIDPDVPEDRIRIANDLVLIKALAEKYIRDDLGVPDEIAVLKSRDALQPIYEYLDADQIKRLQEGGCVLRRKLALNHLEVSVSSWPGRPWPELQNLSLKVEAAHNGVVYCAVMNSDQTLTLRFAFNFNDRKAHTLLEESELWSEGESANARTRIAFLEYRKAVIGNGIIELAFPNRQKVVCEMVIPVNIDIGATFKAIDDQIEELRRQAQTQPSVNQEGHGNRT